MPLAAVSKGERAWSQGGLNLKTVIGLELYLLPRQYASENDFYEKKEKYVDAELCHAPRIQ